VKGQKIGVGCEVQRFRVQPSRRPKKRPVKSRERNYIFVINDEVSYEGFRVQPSRRPKKRPVKSRERNYIFVINDEVSYEGSAQPLA
jgi:hypothetical protein